MRMVTRLHTVLILAACALPIAGQSADWPTWRCDEARSAASSASLPDQMRVAWVRSLPAPLAAWPNEPRLDFDYSYEPVVAGKTLLLSSAGECSLSAFDTETGERRWRFFADAPIRFAPAISGGRAFVGSDDGYLYCLNVSDGGVVWKLRGCPAERPERWHLGNDRLVSYWPIRVGPIVRDGVVYFAAGIWPSFGVFISAADARTGKIIWMNRDSSYMPGVRLDHNEIQETALSPQGYLAISGNMLVVPNGRSMPARFDLASGKRMYFVQGYRNGASRVVLTGNYAFVGETGVVDLRDGREVGNRWVESGNDAPSAFDAAKFDLFEGPFHAYKTVPGCDARSVMGPEGMVYGSAGGVFYAYDTSQVKKSTYELDNAGRKLHPALWDVPEVWQLRTGYADKKPASDALLLAGKRLYGNAGKVLLAVDIDDGAGKPNLAWEMELPGTPTSIIAADDRLFVATREGGLICLSGGEGDARNLRDAVVPPAETGDGWAARTGAILEQSAVREGFCVMPGLGSGRLMEELLRQSDLRVLVVEADQAKVAAAREKLVSAGLYGDRAMVIAGDPDKFSFPQYMASLLVTEDASGLTANPVEELYEVLRPYGGTLCLPSGGEDLEARAKQADLPGAEIRSADGLLLVARRGALPGAASWTHESADAARSYYSRDDRVKAPLGVLWYGDGDGYGFWKHKDYGTGVKPQVIGGRLFAFQVTSRTLQAMDVYTGRQLWQVKSDPFTRFACLEDGVYVAGADGCIVRDPATGEVLRTIKYELPNGAKSFVADMRVGEDIVLIAAATEKVRVIEKGLWDGKYLVALDRASGEQLWTREAADRFNSHGIAVGNGTVFCVDSLASAGADTAARRGEAPKETPSTIVALDARTGKEKWSKEFTYPYRSYGIGSWLGMRGNDDWLALASEPGILLTGKASDLRAFNADSGETVWEKKIGGGQPFIIEGDTFVSQAFHTYDIKTGELVREGPPFQRGGCNYAVGGEHLLFVRDRSVSYIDRDSGERSYLRNIRSGCSNSLVAADGLLNVPCFAVGCICNYPIQTSFAMVNMPEATGWDERGEQVGQQWPKTVPAPGGDPAKPFTFAVLGDNRPSKADAPQPAVYAEIIRRINDSPAEFALNTGDIILGAADSNLANKQLDDFIKVTADLRVPSFVAYGNHELRNEESLEWLEKRIGPSYFAFTYGNSRFYVLNTYVPGEVGKITGEQLTWLRKDLADEGSRLAHRFVFLHQPLYSPLNDTGKRGWTDAENLKELQKLFADSKVDAVFSGHDHYFAWRMVDGVTHVVTGGAGAPPYTAPGALSIHHFMLVSVDGDKVSINMVPMGEQAPPPPPAASPTTAAPAETILARGGAGWRYTDKFPTSAPPEANGKAWYDPAYDTSGWAPAGLPFGYKTGAEVPFATQVAINDGDYYLVGSLWIPTGSDQKALTLNVNSDNGATVYVNGQVVDDDPGASTPPGHNPKYWNRTATIKPGVFKSGLNHIAVRLGNNKGSSDAYLDLEIVAK